MREVHIRPRAQLDIESVFIYVALELGMPQAAQCLIDEIYAAFERLATTPEIGRLVSDGTLDRQYRRSLVKNYWVYYTFSEADLTIWRVFHTRQDIENYTAIDY